MPKIIKKKVSYRKKGYRIKKGVRKVKNQVFKKKVLRAIKTTRELKLAQPKNSSTQFYLFNQSSVPPISFNINLTSVLNNIAQGPGQGDRIGNRIEVKSFIFSGYVTYLQQPEDSNWPIFVKMIILKNKNDPQQPDLSRLFHFGNSDIAPTNTLFDITRKLNTDYYTIFATRLFKLGFSSGNSDGQQNNDFKMTQFFKINLTKHFKRVMYSDNLSTVTNKGMWCVFVGGYADGSLISGNTNLGNISYDVSVSYYD